MNTSISLTGNDAVALFNQYCSRLENNLVEKENERMNHMEAVMFFSKAYDYPCQEKMYDRFEEQK